MINPNSLCPGCMSEKVSDGKCPICGHNPEDVQNPLFLSHNSLIANRYIVGKAIDSNGEGVTYLGFDSATSTIINIREYFPLGLSKRELDGSVMMEPGCEFNYNEGLLKFLDLSKELYKLNELPALFDVLDVIEYNNTAYRITRAIPGISLREFLMRNGGILKWDQARSLFAPLISSISALHKAGIVHRGISPDTLIVGKDGKLRLNGFCIEEVRTAKSAFTSQLFPGFAAAEQYGMAGMQGTWTDVYAFSATIYRTLVGNPPPEATDRLENDNMTIPAKIARETPKPVLETLANALQVLPNDRTHYIDDMRKGLSVSSVQAVPVTQGQPQKATYTTSKDEYAVKKSDSKKKNSTTKMYGLVAFIATAFLLAAIIIFILWTMGFIGGGDSSTSSNISSSSLPLNSTESLASPSSIVFENEVDAMPQFVGMSFSDLISDSNLTSAVKFKIVSKQYSDTYAAGLVIEQSPAKGTPFDVGKTTVELVISAGSYYIAMPDLTGMTQDEATLLLLKLGFKYDNIDFEELRLPDVPYGTIVRTDPEKDMNINTEMPITIYINKYSGSTVTSSDDSTTQN